MTRMDLKKISLPSTKRRIILVGVAVLVVALVASILIMRRGDGNSGDEVRLKIIPDNVDLQVKDVHYTEVGDPDLTWEIQSDTARYVKKDNMAYFDRITIRLIRKDGKSLILTGKEGRLHTDSRDADVLGNVVVVSSNGDQFETDVLHFSNADRRIFTDRKVTLKNPRMEMTGNGMTLFLKDERVNIPSGVRAVIRGR